MADTVSRTLLHVVLQAGGNIGNLQADLNIGNLSEEAILAALPSLDAKALERISFEIATVKLKFPLDGPLPDFLKKVPGGVRVWKVANCSKEQSPFCVPAQDTGYTVWLGKEALKIRCTPRGKNFGITPPPFCNNQNIVPNLDPNWGSHDS